MSRMCKTLIPKVVSWDRINGGNYTKCLEFCRGGLQENREDRSVLEQGFDN